MLASVQPINRMAHPAPGFAPSRPSSKAAPAVTDILEPLSALAVSVRVDRDDEVIAQGDPADFCYVVASGCLRTVRLMEDGRRQVGEFLFPGDLFGWEALDEHDFGVEAVGPATLRRYPRRSLEALVERDRDFARRLRGLAAAQLRASRERLVLLGRKSASERIASFLLEMADRVNPNGQPLMDLPMSRADMADYLGLTIETVCRGLTQLRRHGTIAIERARVAIRDRAALGVASETVH